MRKAILTLATGLYLAMGALVSAQQPSPSYGPIAPPIAPPAAFHVNNGCPGGGCPTGGCPAAGCGIGAAGMAASNGCAQGCQCQKGCGKGCVETLCAWLTYRPLPLPCGCNSFCCTHCEQRTPGLWTYFMYGQGCAGGHDCNCGHQYQQGYVSPPH